jgi:hypothetical protein
VKRLPSRCRIAEGAAASTLEAIAGNIAVVPEAEEEGAAAAGAVVLAEVARVGVPIMVAAAQGGTPVGELAEAAAVAIAAAAADSAENSEVGGVRPLCRGVRPAKEEKAFNACSEYMLAALLWLTSKTCRWSCCRTRCRRRSWRWHVSIFPYGHLSKHVCDLSVGRLAFTGSHTYEAAHATDGLCVPQTAQAIGGVRLFGAVLRRLSVLLQHGPSHRLAALST